jgi:hypothetical protein
MPNSAHIERIDKDFFVGSHICLYLQKPVVIDLPNRDEQSIICGGKSLSFRSRSIDGSGSCRARTPSIVFLRGVLLLMLGSSTNLSPTVHR